MCKMRKIKRSLNTAAETAKKIKETSVHTTKKVQIVLHTSNNCSQTIFRVIVTVPVALVVRSPLMVNGTACILLYPSLLEYNALLLQKFSIIYVVSYPL